jgi:hypothetical protein
MTPYWPWSLTQTASLALRCLLILLAAPFALTLLGLIVVASFFSPDDD